MKKTRVLSLAPLGWLWAARSRLLDGGVERATYEILALRMTQLLTSGRPRKSRFVPKIDCPRRKIAGKLPTSEIISEVNLISTNIAICLLLSFLKKGKNLVFLSKIL